MNTKSWGVGMLFLLGCLILAVGFGNLGAAQVQGPAAGAGRYQFALKALDSSNSVVFVFDSTTGRCWYRDTINAKSGGAGWTDLDSPVAK